MSGTEYILSRRCLSRKCLDRLYAGGLVEPISWEQRSKLKEGETILIALPNTPFLIDHLRILKLSEAFVHADEYVKIKINGGCDSLVSIHIWPDYGLLLAERLDKGEVFLDKGDFSRGVYRKLPGMDIPVTIPATELDGFPSDQKSILHF